MGLIGFHFQVTSGSYYNDEEILEDSILVFITNNLNNNKTYIISDILISKIKVEKLKSIFYYNTFTHEISKFSKDSLEHIIILKPRVHIQNSISFNDSLLFLNSKNYIQIKQLLDITKEPILDRKVQIYLQELIELLKI